MGHSKWNYIIMGVSIMGAIFGALAHSIFLMSFNAFCIVWNWYIGEARRQLEEQDLIVAYEKAKEEQNKD